MPHMTGAMTAGHIWALRRPVSTMILSSEEEEEEDLEYTVCDCGDEFESERAFRTARERLLLLYERLSRQFTEQEFYRHGWRRLRIDGDAFIHLAARDKE